MGNGFRELSKLRNDHEDELVQYASTVQDERKRQREKMRQKLRERQRKKANQGNGKKGGEKGADRKKPPPAENEGRLPRCEKRCGFAAGQR